MVIHTGRGRTLVGSLKGPLCHGPRRFLQGQGALRMAAQAGRGQTWGVARFSQCQVIFNKQRPRGAGQLCEGHPLFSPWHAADSMPVS